MERQMDSQQAEINSRVWRTRDNVADYANRSLRPVEIVLLMRYAQALSGRVLEAGCGAGRVLGYLVALGGDVHGVDVSRTMVDYCGHTYPEADVRLGDLAALAESVTGPFDAVIVPDNTLDIFGDEQRRRVLSEIRELLAPGGVLIFSSHNLDHADGRPEARGPAGARGRGGAMLARGGAMLARVAGLSPERAARAVIRLRRRRRNRRALVGLQQRADDHAILNDSERDYGVLHYYIGRDAQERQLSSLGFELVECLDVEGRPVARGAIGYGPWLHYVVRAAQGT
jgi:SAM-dependent methyltransferase